MIRVSVDLVPFGIESKAYNLGSLIISNDGTGTKTKGNYDVRLCQAGGADKTVVKVSRTARVEGHPRAAVSVWKLVAKALVAVGHKV